MQSTLPLPETQRPGAPAGRWLDVSALVSYLALAIWVVGPLWTAPDQLRPEANAADPDFFQWALGTPSGSSARAESVPLPALNAPLGSTC